MSDREEQQITMPLYEIKKNWKKAIQNAFPNQYYE
jgi:lipopolysaccharide biosynthesis regulator YciM